MKAPGVGRRDFLKDLTGVAAIDQHWVRPAPLANGGRDLRHLGFGVCTGIAGVGDKVLHGPTLDPIRGPFRIVSQAG